MKKKSRDKINFKKYKIPFVVISFLLVFLVSIFYGKIIRIFDGTNYNENLIAAVDGEGAGGGAGITDNTPHSIVVGYSYVYLEPYSSYNVVVIVKNKNDENITNNVSITASSSNAHARASVNGGYVTITGQSEGNGTVTVKAGDKTASIGFSVYCQAWTKINNKAIFNSLATKSIRSTNSGCYYQDYSACTRKTDANGNSYYECDSYYTRCCGETPPAPEVEACYKNNSTGEYTWGKFSGNNGYTKISGINNADDCVTPPDDVDVSCNSNIRPANQNKSVNSCNGATSVDLNTGKSCASTINGTYYNISCSPETVNVKFNPDDFSNPFYAGQGFEYNIQVTSTRTCGGSFDSRKWNDAYEKVTYGVDYYKKRMNDTKYSEAERKNYASSYNEYLNKLKDLVNMVIDYNNYKNELMDAYTMTPTATMGIYQTKKVNGIVTEEKLVAEPRFDNIKITQEGVGRLSVNETYHLSASKRDIENYGITATGFENPVRFSYTNRSNPKKGEFNLAKSYINKNTGEVSNNNYSGNSNWIDAGNKYYTSLNLNSNYTYIIKINVSNLGAMKNLSVNNIHCEFKIKENNQKLIYRHVDAIDPFISGSSRETGSNWLNSRYDFTKVIKPSKAVLYKFNISKAEIAAIKKSNSLISGSNEYLGVCQNSLHDKDIVCEMLKGNDY